MYKNTLKLLTLNDSHMEERSSLENYTSNNTTQHEKTRHNTRQHETTRVQHETTRVRQATIRDNTSTKQHKIRKELGNLKAVCYDCVAIFCLSDY